MKIYCHAPWVPDELEPLLDVAYNFWWTTDPQAQWLFRRLAPGLWDKVDHNPVRLLRDLTREELSFRARNAEIVRVAGELRDRMLQELGAEGRFRIPPVRRGHDELELELNPLAAYFSAEFALHESLPIYSGGLGVLAGEHVRSTSDLGIPFVAIGLLYRFGYFHQRFSLDEWQVEEYEPLGFHNLPLRIVENDDGSALEIPLNLPERQVFARVWLAQVGRTPLLLLDTYTRSNSVDDRNITARLYDSDRDMRLKQEILLGVGGVRVLDALHVTPRRFHMNEGHSAFLVLERAAQLIAQKDISFEEARRITRSSNVFTTHTPVAAGHEVFSCSAMEPYFRPQFEKLRIDHDGFFALGHRTGSERLDEFQMTSLAIRFSESINGVSELHGHVSREQWNCMWPDVAQDEVPIGHVTNGVHMHSWVGPEMRALLDEELGADWPERIEEPDLWRRLDEIDDARLWEARCRQRARLIEFGLARIQRQLITRNTDSETLEQKITAFSGDALTIGFARRFATYKRAALIFRQLERIAALVGDADRPVQLIFAGKAHPADDGGKELLREVLRHAKSPTFFGRVLVLEDYDMNLARHLVQGADVWLNNPRPPKEASGTSGMKVIPNGGLTLSTRDGWWVEGYNGSNGWSIGDGARPAPDHEIDDGDAESLLTLLDHEVIPLFYERDEQGIPRGWVAKMRESLKTITPYFNTRRMVREYAEKYYLG